MMRKQFKAPWDMRLISITTTVIILFGGILYIDRSWITQLMLGIIFGGSAIFGVYGYSIQDDQLRIVRLGWSTDIPLNDIRHAEVKPHATMGSIRTFGNGGLFGYIGKFRNSVLGSYRAYATYSSKSVLIQTIDQQIIITPDDPEEFIHSLGEERPQTISSTT